MAIAPPPSRPTLRAAAPASTGPDARTLLAGVGLVNGVPTDELAALAGASRQASALATPESGSPAAP